MITETISLIVKSAIIVALATVFLCYRFATALLQKLGEIGTMIMMRVMSFILMCIGLQMMWTGWAELNGMAH